MDKLPIPAILKFSESLTDKWIIQILSGFDNQTCAAKQNLKDRRKQIIEMSISIMTTEDLLQAIRFNNLNLDEIAKLNNHIKFFTEFRAYTESNETDLNIRTQRIGFANTCLQKIYRMIAIHKATVIKIE
jgi:glutaredoxin 2